MSNEIKKIPMQGGKYHLEIVHEYGNFYRIIRCNSPIFTNKPGALVVMYKNSEGRNRISSFSDDKSNKIFEFIPPGKHDWDKMNLDEIG